MLPNPLKSPIDAPLLPVVLAGVLDHRLADVDEAEELLGPEEEGGGGKGGTVNS